MNRYIKCLLTLIFGVHTLLPLSLQVKGTPENQSVKKLSSGERNWPVFRVEFAADDNETTSGTGTFMAEWDPEDTVYAFDPVPHNTAYFQAHLQAIGLYWSAVTRERITVNTSPDQLIPSVIVLNQTIRYYSRPDKPDSIDIYLAKMLYDIFSVASTSGVMPVNPSEAIIYHAGIGQDFDFSSIFDPTPFDIPSFYYDESFIRQNLPEEQANELLEMGISKGIVLPEMQNQLGVNIALNGTEILLSGFLLGLPALYDTETGTSKAGIFGLMDQGSNNAAGLVPVYPSAFERMILGVADIQPAASGDFLLNDGQIIRADISDKEYFLIEYRHNAGVYLDSLYDALDSENYLDALNVYAADSDFDIYIDEASGVVTGVSDYDITLPANGFLIWHINEPYWDYQAAELSNPNGGPIPMLRLEEADGGYDIGKEYGILSGSVNQGWKWDMWFEDNPGFSDNNPSLRSVQMTDTSHPSTRSFSNFNSGHNFRSFKPAGFAGTLNILYADQNAAMYPSRFYQQTIDENRLYIQDEFLVYESASAGSDTLLSDLANPLYTNARLLETNELLVIENLSNATKVRLLAMPSGQVVSTLLIPGAVDLAHWIYDDNKSRVILQIVSDSGMRSLCYANLSLGTYVVQPLISADYCPMVLGVSGLIYGDNMKIMSDTGELIHQYQSEILSLASLNDTVAAGLSGGGFSFIDLSTGNATAAVALDYSIQKIIPAHLDRDGQIDVLAVVEKNGRSGWAVFSHYGVLWNQFPIYDDVKSLRLAKTSDSYYIAAYYDTGKLAMYSLDGSILGSGMAGADVKAFFWSDDGSLIADGLLNTTLAQTISDFTVLWPYEHGNLFGTSAYDYESDKEPVSTETIIRNGLIYNYPNPVAHTSTKIRFYANESASADVWIFDLSGTEVTHLNSQTIPQQWNEITWNITDLPSGIYVAKIRFSGNSSKEEYIIKPAILR